MTEENERRIFVWAGEPVGVISGTDSRFRREGDALVVLPDERWGNPLFGEACLDESDFHIHARLTLDRVAGTGASVLLGGHYHYNWSRPEGNYTFRICLDEDRYPAPKSLDKVMKIVHGRTDPRAPWFPADDTFEKQVVGACREYFNPGEPFTVDIVRRGEDLTFQINGRDVFRICLTDGSRLAVGRCGDPGWPISVGLLPGRGTLRIHELWAHGSFPSPVFPTTDAWQQNSDDYSHYRIPSLCMGSNGRLLAFAEARRSYLSRGWEWNMMRGTEMLSSEIHCAMKHSDDNGRSWSEPRSLSGALPGDFKQLCPGVGNAAIQLRHGPFRGRLLVALYTKNTVGLIFSDDHGRSWQPGAHTAFSNASEPTIVELSNGKVLVSPRTMGAPESRGRLFMFSHDGGCSFAETRYEPSIPIPNRGELLAVDMPEAAATEAVRPIVFCGAAERGTRLTLFVSMDDGQTWPISQVLDDGSAANLAMVALGDGQVGVLYERDKYRRLSFQRVDLAQVS